MNKIMTATRNTETLEHPLEHCWRWYGPDDLVGLDVARQSGATGIVTALHHVPNGEVWTIEEIQKRQGEVVKQDLLWSVVESVPVHDDIKLGCGKHLVYIENYKQSLINLAHCGIHIVTYNFMPLLDWTRTDLEHVLEDGSTALRFDEIDAAVFDMLILKRVGAADDHADPSKAEERFQKMTTQQVETLTRNIIAGLPGSEDSFQLPQFREALSRYDGSTYQDIQANLFQFLDAVMPVAEEAKVHLAIHPDDPPCALIGLPRVVSTRDDIRQLVDHIALPSNGLCFCTGSFGSGSQNDVESMASEFADRIHFAHARNVTKYNTRSFFESGHIDGDVDMATVLAHLMNEMQRSGRSIPIRPDHGPRMLTDRNLPARPGYYGIGRLRGLAELRGLERGITHGRNIGHLSSTLATSSPTKVKTQ